MGKHVFTLNEKEEQEFEKFKKKHRECRGLFKISFTPTGIGNDIEVKCTVCKKKKNITDVESW